MTSTRVLTPEQKAQLFQTAGSKPDWMVAHCAAVLPVSTTCRGVELKHLQWSGVDLFNRVLNARRSKRDGASGHSLERRRSGSTGATLGTGAGLWGKQS